MRLVGASTTWTPTITAATPGNLSLAYAVQVGRYLRVGDMVNLWVRLTFTPTFTNATGNLILAGVPVAAGATVDNMVGSMHLQSVSSTGPTYPTGCTNVVPMIAAGASTILFAAQGTGAAGAANPVLLPITGLTTARQYRMSMQLTYLVV